MIIEVAAVLMAILALQGSAGSVPLDPSIAQFGKMIPLPNAAMQPRSKTGLQSRL